MLSCVVRCRCTRKTGPVGVARAAMGRATRRMFRLRGTAKGTKIRWKTPLPGVGHSSPIVFGERDLRRRVPRGQPNRVLLCLDRTTGRILWEQTVVNAPLEKKHRLNSHASSTPATDGKFVYVTFLDRDAMLVAAYDFDGRQQWLVRPGAFHSVHGYCSSPVLFENLVIVNGDHDGDAYLVALDKATGKTVWKTPRENKTRSYCAPLIRQIDGRWQMVLSGSKCVASFDPAMAHAIGSSTGRPSSSSPRWSTTASCFS